MISHLPDAPWRHRLGLEHLLVVLGGHLGESRYVGGAVRDTILSAEVSDVDLATIHSPTQVLERLQLSGIKAVPTGIAHGTITAVVDSRPYEITTLRSDVSTDGRRATVAYTDSWQADAARRDFTINALYAHTQTGEISDFFGGIDDLMGRHVRFIGDAVERIREDHLRILRYFRFFARYGDGNPDPVAYDACCSQANSLMALSRERIADELLKLLGLPSPIQAIELMIAGGIFVPVLPEIDVVSLERLKLLLQRETMAGYAGDAILRLCAMLPPDADRGEAIAARLKLSNKARKRIMAALSQPPHSQSARELSFRCGSQAAQDIIMLGRWGSDPSEATRLGSEEVPQLPVGGAALITLGLSSGPIIARALHEIKEQWIAEDFPGPQRVHEIAAQIASKFQRECQ